MKRILLAALVAVATATTTFAVDMVDMITATWTGEYDGQSWSASENWWKVAPDGWSGQQVPFDGNAVIIDGDSGTFARDDKMVDVSGSITLSGPVTLSNGAALNVSGELAFTSVANITGGTVFCGFLAGQDAEGTKLTIDNCQIIDECTAHSGFWQGATHAPYLNFAEIASGNEAKFTYKTAVSSDPYVFFFSGNTPRIRYNDTIISSDEFDDYFTVTQEGEYTTVALNATIPTWKIAAGAVSDIGETTATLHATVKKVGSESAYVYYVYDTSRSAVESALGSVTTLTQYSGTAAVKDDAVTIPLTSLATETTYYYAFALVSGGEVVATTGVSSFTPSAYDNIYENGEWSNGTPVTGQRLLFKSSIMLDQTTYNNKTFAAVTIDVEDGTFVSVADYTGVTVSGALTIRSGSVSVANTSYLHYGTLTMEGGRFSIEVPTQAHLAERNILLNGGDLVIANKPEVYGSGFMMRNASIEGVETYKADGENISYLTAINSRITSNRSNSLEQAPYGLWGGNQYFDFRRESADQHVFSRACAFSFNYNETWIARTSAQVYADLFETGKIIVAGKLIDSETFDATFLLSTDETALTQTITMFDTLGSMDGGAYTVQDGARVKLTENVKLDSLTVEGTGAVIDLNGHTLKVPANALTVNGEVIAKGTYTGKSLPTGFTNGTVEVLSPGLVLVFR